MVEGRTLFRWLSDEDSRKYQKGTWPKLEDLEDEIIDRGLDDNL